MIRATTVVRGITLVSVMCSTINQQRVETLLAIGAATPALHPLIPLQQFIREEPLTALPHHQPYHLVNTPA